MPKVYAHIFAQRGFLGIYPYEKIARFIEGNGDFSFLVQGPESELAESCKYLPGSHLVESLRLTIGYRSKARKGKITEEMSPIGALLFLDKLTKRSAWEFLRRNYRGEYEKYTSPIISLARGITYKLILPQDGPSFGLDLPKQETPWIYSGDELR